MQRFHAPALREELSWRVAIFLTTMWLVCAPSFATADTSPPTIVPGFSDSQVFETLGNLSVYLQDDTDTSPTLSDVQLNSSKSESLSLTTVFEQKCPSGFFEKDNVCLNETTVAATMTCPDEYEFNGADCTKRVVVAVDPPVECPVGYVIDPSQDQYDLLKQCIKVKTVPGTLACAEPYTLHGGACYRTLSIDEGVAPAVKAAYGNNPPDARAMTGGIVTGFPSFLSPVDSNYYLPPSSDDRRYFSSQWRFKTMIEKGSCPYGYTAIPSDKADWSGGLGVLDDAGFAVPQGCYLRSEAWIYPEGTSLYSHASRLSTGDACTAEIKHSRYQPSRGVAQGAYYMSGASPICVLFEEVQTECPATIQAATGLFATTVKTVDTVEVGLAGTLGDGCLLVGTVTPQQRVCEDGYAINDELNLCTQKSSNPQFECPVNSSPEAVPFTSQDKLQVFKGDSVYSGQSTTRSFSTLTGSPLGADQCWGVVQNDGTPKCMDGALFDPATAECVTTDVATKVPQCDEGFSLNGSVCNKTETTGKVRSNTANIVLPVIAPGDYSLDLLAQDNSGNQTFKSLSFSYVPRGFALQGGANVLRVPGVSLALSRPDGSPALVTQTLTEDGRVLSGPQPVYASVMPGAPIPLLVEGKLVEPGKTVEVSAAYDMSESGGRLRLSVAPYYEGVEGVSGLMLTVGDTGSLVSMFDVQVWTFAPFMNVTPPEPLALFRNIDVRASGTGCTPVATREKAMEYDVFDAPACYIRWNQIPAGLSVSASQPALQGVLDNAGEQTASFEAVIVEPSGFETVVGSYSETFNALDFYGSIKFEMSGNEKPVLAGVDTHSYTLRQYEGPSCIPAISEEEALSITSGQNLVCLIEWVSPPHSMEPMKVQSAPALRGAVPLIGENSLSWRVSLFDSGGQKVIVNEQSAIVLGEEPETPNVVITADSTYDTSEGSTLNLAAPGDGYDAFVSVVGADAPMAVQMFVDGVEVYSKVHENRFGDANRVTLPVSLPDASLWHSQDVQVKVGYETMSGYTSDVSASFLTVPSSDIEPELDSRYLEAVNTGNSPMTIIMKGRSGEAYDADTMGRWDARLVKEVGFQRYEPVTDFVTLAGSETTSDLNFNNMMNPGEVARVLVEARLISPLPEYQRTVMSRYPTSIALLDGSAIEGKVKATRMSGSAPVRGIFTLALDDRGSRGALKEVVWEVSSDGGSTWDVQEDGVRGYQLRRSFDTGDYLLRTRTVNKYTGEEFTTEPLLVTAYTRPDIDIEGPASAFLGADVIMKADLKDDSGNILDPNDFFLEWSTDNGKTFEVGSNSVTLTSNERTDVRVILRARDKRAPESDFRAYAQSRAPLAFRAVKAPRVYIRGSRAAEVGQEITLKAAVSAPYLRMKDQMNGHWVLPDGSTSNAEELTFIAPRLAPGEDYLYINYVAWVDGYREQGAEVTREHRMRFWEYKFPEFRIEARQSADVAPVEISAYVRPLGFTGSLEDPQYEWSIPDGIDVTWDRTGRARVMKIDEPGSYTVRAKVTDGRGNESITTRTFDIGVADPLAVDMEVRGRTALRAPYEILVRPIITGGHPRDYYEELQYVVDGTPLEGRSRYGRVTLPQGDHTVNLNVTTRMGEKASGSVSLSVPPNQPPTCEMTHWESYGSWRLNADCTDPDGRLRDYVWSFDGEPVSISSSRISIPSSLFGDKPEITASLKAKDDSGDYSPLIEVQLRNLNQ